MKRFTNVALIKAGIMAGITLVCMIGAVTLGFTWGTLSDMVLDGKFSFGSDGKADGSITEVEEAIGSLDVELSAGKLEIYYDEVEKIQVDQVETPNFQCYVKNGTLHVEGGQRLGTNNNVASIVIRIPRNYSFEEFELEVGAGEATVDSVIADEASISVGAGKASITNLDAKDIDAEAGAGELYIEMVGKKEDYSYNLECDVGTIRIGDESYTGLGTEKKIKNPNAKLFLEADCDVGKVQIDFTE